MEAIEISRAALERNNIRACLVSCTKLKCGLKCSLLVPKMPNTWTKIWTKVFSPLVHEGLTKLD